MRSVKEEKMVGYDPGVAALPQLDVALAGATSGIITRAICQPLDVLKIRFQLQTAQKQNAKYRNVIQASCLIIREEGIQSLWKGHIPAQFLSIVYGISQFWCYEVLTRKAYSIEPNLRSELKPLVHFSCGAAAGSVATLFSFPFDVIRTRLVAQSERSKAYRGVTDAMITIYRTEGPKSFYRGFLPSIMQIAPHTGAQFMFYKLFISIYDYISSHYENKDSYEIPMFESLTCGSLAGLCAKVVIYPLDLAKKRMQVQGFDMKSHSFEKRSFVCNGFWDCIFKTVKHEGTKGLFKGLSASLIKATCTTALHFSVYEETCKLLRTVRGI